MKLNEEQRNLISALDHGSRKKVVKIYCIPFRIWAMRT